LAKTKRNERSPNLTTSMRFGLADIWVRFISVFKYKETMIRAFILLGRTRYDIRNKEMTFDYLVHLISLTTTT